MYRRNEYRDDLLAEVCADVLGIDSRYAEIDDLLSDRRQAPQCPTCATPILRGARYCPNCGRDFTAPVGASPPVEAP
jgi:predicted amidophosphoribosyltransferase